MDELMPTILSLLSTMPALSGEETGIKPDCTEKEESGGLEEEIINLIMKYGMNSSNKLKLKINEIDIVLIFIIIVLLSSNSKSLLSSNSKSNDINILKYLPVLSSIMLDS